MLVVWEINDDVKRRVSDFVSLKISNTFVQRRIRRNIQKERPEINHASFWHVLISCLLTTQQRSGPESRVNKLIGTEPFPLSFTVCQLNENDLANFVQTILSDFGGIRRTNRIADEISQNYLWLEKGGWEKTMSLIKQLENNPSPNLERYVARFIQDSFAGCGPKQSRNLLQELGLTKNEIPIDSRITKWLNDFGFPIVLSANALGDENYYCFVLDGIQHLCKAANIEPCVLDAAIFSSFD